jgi:hypothetical protein
MSGSAGWDGRWLKDKEATLDVFDRKMLEAMADRQRVLERIADSLETLTEVVILHVNRSPSVMLGTRERIEKIRAARSASSGRPGA